MLGVERHLLGPFGTRLSRKVTSERCSASLGPGHKEKYRNHSSDSPE